MGTVITTSEIAASYSKGVGFFSSFGGNPVSCAIGLSVLKAIEEPNPPADGIRVAMTEQNVAPIELIEFKNEIIKKSEEFKSTWYRKLVLISLSSESPGKSMTIYKHKGNDTFRRIRYNDELGETLVFERDKNGTIIQYKSHGNYTKKQIDRTYTFYMKPKHPSGCYTSHTIRYENRSQNLYQVIIYHYFRFGCRTSNDTVHYPGSFQ